MRAYASYEIVLHGTAVEINEAVDSIADIIGDQPDALPNLLDRYYSDEDDDEEEDLTPLTFEEVVEVWETRDCVWIEDIIKLSVEIAVNSPDIQFSISGHINDDSDVAGDEMDFKITYKEKKLLSQTTDWYQYIHMDDINNYNAFASRFCDAHGNPRYTQEDFEGFRDCADEWYVLDGGHGEFSTTVPFNDPVRIKLKFS